MKFTDLIRYNKYYSRRNLREKYASLLARCQKMMLREHELEKALHQANNQIDYQNEMISTLLKQRREAVDKRLEV